MMESQLRTITVPGTPTDTPANLAVAGDVPLRVVLENVGATPLRISFASSALGGVTSDGVDHFQLLTGRQAVVVMAPNQRLYAVSVGATGSLSVAVSEALPFDVRS